MVAVLLSIYYFADRIWPKIWGTNGVTRAIATQAEMTDVCIAIDKFQMDCGRYPTQGEGLAALDVKPSGLVGWRGPYLKQVPSHDEWGHPYHYRVPSSNGKRYEVISYGADGVPGGDGEDADQSDGSVE